MRLTDAVDGCICDDQMVNDLDTHYLAGGDQLLSRLKIIRAWLRRSRGMIVRQYY